MLKKLLRASLLISSLFSWHTNFGGSPDKIETLEREFKALEEQFELEKSDLIKAIHRHNTPQGKLYFLLLLDGESSEALAIEPTTKKKYKKQQNTQNFSFKKITATLDYLIPKLGNGTYPSYLREFYQAVTSFHETNANCKKLIALYSANKNTENFKKLNSAVKEINQAKKSLQEAESKFFSYFNTVKPGTTNDSQHLINLVFLASGIIEIVEAPIKIKNQLQIEQLTLEATPAGIDLYKSVMQDLVNTANFLEYDSFLGATTLNKGTTNQKNQSLYFAQLSRMNKFENNISRKWHAFSPIQQEKDELLYIRQLAIQATKQKSNLSSLPLVLTFKKELLKQIEALNKLKTHPKFTFTPLELDFLLTTQSYLHYIFTALQNVETCKELIQTCSSSMEKMLGLFSKTYLNLNFKSTLTFPYQRLIANLTLYLLQEIDIHCKKEIKQLHETAQKINQLKMKISKLKKTFSFKIAECETYEEIDSKLLETAEKTTSFIEDKSNIPDKTPTTQTNIDSEINITLASSIDDWNTDPETIYLNHKIQYPNSPLSETQAKIFHRFPKWFITGSWVKQTVTSAVKNKGNAATYYAHDSKRGVVQLWFPARGQYIDQGKEQKAEGALELFLHYNPRALNPRFCLYHAWFRENNAAALQPLDPQLQTVIKTFLNKKTTQELQPQIKIGYNSVATWKKISGESVENFYNAQQETDPKRFTWIAICKPF